MKNNNTVILKLLWCSYSQLMGLFGTLLVKSEFLAMSGFAAILFVFSILYLKIPLLKNLLLQ